MNASIAETVLAQLGGNKFLAMTGAVVVATPYGLSMKLPKPSKLTGMTIELDASADTYEVQGYTGRGVRFQREGGMVCAVHVDQIRKTFTDLTGLAVSL